MPYLAAINTENGLVAGLASLAATSQGIAQRRRDRDRMELEERQLKLREDAQELQRIRYEAESAAVAAKQEREAARNEAMRAALGQQIQGIRAEAERQLQPKEKMRRQIEHRLGRVRDTARRFLEAGDEAGARRYVEQSREGLQRFVVSRGFEMELQDVQKAALDGLMTPEQAEAAASIVQQTMAVGGKPGKVSGGLAKLREKKALEQVRLGEWAEADQEMAGLISTVRDPKLKERLKVEAQLSQAPSIRTKEGPEQTMAKLKRLALSEDRETRGRPTMGELEEFSRSPEYQQYLERQRAERQSRGGLGVSDTSDDSNDFMELPATARSQAISALRELVNTPGLGDREIQSVLDQFNLDPSTIPPDIVRELVGADALKRIYGG